MSISIAKRSYKMFINGNFVESKTNERFERISPSHDTAVGTYPLGGIDDTRAAI